MSASEQGLTVRGRWDAKPMVSPEQARALADFHQRTNHNFGQVTDLSLIGTYARSQGWEFIAEALLPRREAAVPA